MSFSININFKEIVSKLLFSAKLKRVLIFSASNDTEHPDYMRIEVPREGQITCRDCIHLKGKICP